MSNLNELLCISKYLTKEYLSEHMTKWFNQNVEYCRHEFGKGTGKGDSYLSDVHRVVLCGKTKENLELFTNVIIKSLPRNIAYRKSFRSSDFFRNEINFYLRVLPVLIEFQAEKDIENPFNHFPKVFAAETDGENDFLALEDLTVYNFITAVRQEGIDYPHCKLILERFAKFHALSFAFKDQQSENFATLITKISETICDKKYWNWYKNYWNNVCKCAIDAVENEYPNTIYVEKVKEFANEKTYQKSIAVVNEIGRTEVFNHGDSWTPNFLFKYAPASNLPIDAKMIDFQLTRCVSPVLDISFFIYACTTEELRKEYYNSILKHYHDILAKQITALGSNPEKLYPWNFFMDEMKKYAFFGLAFSFESTPVIILDPEDAFDVNLKGTEAVDISTVIVIKPMKSKNGRQRVAGNVIHAINNEYI